MAQRGSGSSPQDQRNRVVGGRALLALCALAAAMMIFGLAFPHPFQGIGLLAVPLIPVILFYHAVLLGAIGAGILLAIACFWRGGVAHIASGLGLIALSIASIAPMIREHEESRIAEDRSAAANAAFDVEVAKCVAVMTERAAEAVTYFAEPRKVVAFGGAYEVEFENGMRIHLPPIHPPQPFHEFFHDHLQGSQVRVALRPPSAGALHGYCRLVGSSIPTGYTKAYEGDVYLLDRKIDEAAYVDRDFPRPERPSGIASAPSRKILRWFDAHTGNRTYLPTGSIPAAGHVHEGQPFALRLGPWDDSRALYLCNFPLVRPASPEHFVSTDANCEGYETIVLLGHISQTRDGNTPRALLRCLGTVQSPLRTGPRHLITTDIVECRNHAMEGVLGYVER